MKYLPLVLLILLSINSHSQEIKDTIYFKNNSIQDAFVLKISDKDIHYKEEVDSRVEYVIKKSKLEQIVFSNGKRIQYQNSGILLEKKINVGLSLSYSSSIVRVLLNAEYMYAKGFSAKLKANSSTILVGSKYYFKPESTKRLKFSTGVLIGYDGSAEHSGTVSFNNGPQENIGLFLVNIPLDLTYQLKKGFNINLGVSYNHGSNTRNKDIYTFKSKWPEFELGFGYRF